MAQEQTEAMPRKALWNALYGDGGDTRLTGTTKLQLDFVVNDRVRGLLDEATAFLNTLPQKPAAEPKVRDGALDDTIAREVLAARGLQSPIGAIQARPLAEYSGPTD